MESRNILTKRLFKRKGLLITAIVLLVVSLGLIAGSLFAKDDVSEAKEYYGLGETVGTLVYVDVVGVDDWICEYDEDVYYTVLDANDYFDNVILTKAQFNKLKAQYAYYLDETGTVEKPEPVRIYGVVEKPIQDVVDMFNEVYDISEDDYYYYFGDFIVNANRINESSKGLIYLGLTVGFFALIFGGIYLSELNKFNKQLDALDAKNSLDQAAEELMSAQQIGNLFLTDNFLFCTNNAIAVAYGDIEWIFTRSNSVNFIPVAKTFVVNTNKISELIIAKNKYMQFEELMQRIAEANPNVLLGYSLVNAQVYNSERKIK